MRGIVVSEGAGGCSGTLTSHLGRASFLRGVLSLVDTWSVDIECMGGRKVNF